MWPFSTLLVNPARADSNLLPKVKLWIPWRLPPIQPFAPGADLVPTERISSPLRQRVPSQWASFQSADLLKAHIRK